MAEPRATTAQWVDVMRGVLGMPPDAEWVHFSSLSPIATAADSGHWFHVLRRSEGESRYFVPANQLKGWESYILIVFGLVMDAPPTEQGRLAGLDARPG